MNCCSAFNYKSIKQHFSTSSHIQCKETKQLYMYVYNLDEMGLVQGASPGLVQQPNQSRITPLGPSECQNRTERHRARPPLARTTRGSAHSLPTQMPQPLCGVARFASHECHRLPGCSPCLWRCGGPHNESCTAMLLLDARAAASTRSWCVG
jgi:hypothetical protein